MKFIQRRLTLILIAASVAAIFLIGYQITNARRFRIVDTTPSNVLPTSTNVITLEFNRTLKATDQQPENYITLDPELQHSVSINETSLRILLNEQPEKDTTLKINLMNITSNQQETLSTDINYAVEYVPFNKLSDEERQRQIANVGTPDSRHPLLQKLPHDAISYRIEYTGFEGFGTAADWKSEKDNFAVYVTTYAYSGYSKEEYKSASLELRASAREWIREQGVDPDNDINIIYNPSDESLDGTESTADGGEPAFIEGENIEDKLTPKDIYNPEETQ